jgi:hypothetical protein
MAQRKIAGNLGHDELRKAYQSGYVGKVKVHLQELKPGGKAGHLFRELTHWTQISINRTVGNKGRATISLANVNDRHFDNASQRIFKPEKAEITRNYLDDLHRRVLGNVKEINPNRRKTNTFDFQGLRSFDKDDVKRYVEFLYNFDGFDGGRKAAAQAGGKPDLPALGLIQRVIIDEQGPDGKWYALFTGIVSSIEDRYTAGEVPVIDLVCLDYWRLFDLSEIVIKTGADPIVDSFQFTLLGANAQVAAQNSKLADLKAKDILALIMDIVQRTMCWIPYSLWRERAPMPDGTITALYDVPDKPYSTSFPDPKSRQVQTVIVSKSNFFNEEPFWYTPLDPGQQSILPASSYEGHDCLRHYAEAPPALEGQAKRMQNGDEPFDGMQVGQLYSTLLVDKYIENGIQGTPYAFFIAAILQPWETNKAVGSTIVRRVAEATYYDVSITPNGDVLYQIPKYNNCPGEYSPSGALVPEGATPPPSAAPVTFPFLQGEGNAPLANAFSNQVATGGKSYESSKWPDGDYDYAPAPEGFSQRHHGFNYVITDVGNRGWRLSSSEEGLVTAVSVPFGQQILQSLGAPNLDSTQATGRTPVDDTVDIVARFGLRRFEAQKMSVNNIYNQQNNQAFMDTFAMALLQQINGRAFGGTLDLSGRPDLDLGKNVYHVERQKLLYVMGISHAIRQGQDRSTTLQVAYGHDISREIVSPFVSTRNINSGTSVEGGTAAGSGSDAASPGQVSGAILPNVVSGSGGTPLAGASLGVPTVAVSDDAANDFVIPASYTGAIVSGLAAAVRRAPNFALTSASLTPTGVVIKGIGINYVNVDPNDLLRQAIETVRAKLNNPDFNMTLDEYTLARFIASEERDVLAQVLVAQTIRNVAAGPTGKVKCPRSSRGIVCLALRTVHSKLTPITHGFYGNQVGKYAATSQNPKFRHLLIAKAVLQSNVQIVPNLVHFLNVKVKSQPGLTQTARTTLTDWTSGKNGDVWIGEVAGLERTGVVFLRRRRSSDTQASILKAQLKLLARS